MRAPAKDGARRRVRPDCGPVGGDDLPHSLDGERVEKGGSGGRSGDLPVNTGEGRVHGGGRGGVAGQRAAGRQGRRPGSADGPAPGAAQGAVQALGPDEEPPQESEPRAQGVLLGHEAVDGVCRVRAVRHLARLDPRNVGVPVKEDRVRHSRARDAMEWRANDRANHCVL
jgi:hypothetical protein